MKGCQMVTGGAGFIGSNFVRRTLAAGTPKVVIVDKLTYAGNLATLEDVLQDERVVFVQADIADTPRIRQLVHEHRPRAIVNFAAESHVDRSIDGPRNFLQSNTVGVFELLECARVYYGGITEEEQHLFRFLQVSTDEVFGTLGAEGAFTEDTPYAPRSPYSATKAGADHLVRAYHETFGLPTLITNCSNNYGPYQYPEKLIPLMVLKAMDGEPLPVYGLGENVRDWLHVEDHCEAISLVLERGGPGATYNIGARNERTNLEVVYAVCEALEELLPAAENPRVKKPEHSGYRGLVTFVEDRPGHDFRYAIDPTRVERDLGWRPRKSFRSSLKETVEWYVHHRPWCDEVRAETYRGERLGLVEGKK